MAQASCIACDKKSVLNLNGFCKTCDSKFAQSKQCASCNKQFDNPEFDVCSDCMPMFTNKCERPDEELNSWMRECEHASRSAAAMRECEHAPRSAATPVAVAPVPAMLSRPVAVAPIPAMFLPIVHQLQKICECGKCGCGNMVTPSKTCNQWRVIRKCSCGKQVHYWEIACPECHPIDSPAMLSRPVAVAPVPAMLPRPVAVAPVPAMRPLPPIVYQLQKICECGKCGCGNMVTPSKTCNQWRVISKCSCGKQVHYWEIACPECYPIYSQKKF